MDKPRSSAEWLFCGTLLLQAIVISILEAFTLGQWGSWVHPNIIQITTSYIVPVNLGILIFTFLYLFVLAIDATYHRNDILLLAICASNTCALVYASMQYRSMGAIIAHLPLSYDGMKQPFVDLDRSIWPQVQPAQLAAPIIVGLCTVVIWPLSYQLHRQYAWEVYRSIHGDSDIKMRYLAYEIYIVLVKLDFYFIIGFILQYNLIDVHFQEPEYSLTMAIIPAAIIVMFLGIYCVRSERKAAMVPIILCYIAMVAYLLSRIIILLGHTLASRTAGKDMMLLFAFVALILTVLNIVCVIRCTLNFDRGLKPILKPAKRTSRMSRISYRSPASDQPPSPVHSSHTRMSID